MKFLLLINCDPFHSFSFPFICYFFEAAAQKRSPELCENTCIGDLHKKTEVSSIHETTSSKFLSCKICEIFQSSFFLEQHWPNVSVWGVGPAQPYQSSKYVIWLTKQINTLTSNQSYFVKQVILAEAGVHSFLEYFQFRQGITLQCICKCILLIIRCFLRIVDKRTDK